MNPTPLATGLLTGLGAAITTDPALGGAGAPTAPGAGDLFLSLVSNLLAGGTSTPAVPATPGATDPTTTTTSPAVATGTPSTDPIAVVPADASDLTGGPLRSGRHGRRGQSVLLTEPDEALELARLFHDVGEIGTNVEDVFIDHDPGRPVGLTELVVAAAAADGLREALEARKWTVHR